jgi:hypothetical protein
LILKMKSAGPAIGNMSKTSLKFFFMACYDMDRFREFVKSEGFSTTYDVEQETMDRILADDLALLEFGDRMIRQIMYAEKTIPLKSDALEQHLDRRGDRKSTVHDDMARPSMAAYGCRWTGNRKMATADWQVAGEPPVSARRLMS